jgi:hypothetical protein
MSWEDPSLWFDEEWAELTTLTLNDSSQVEVQAMWNLGDDPLFGDRASATQINFLLPSQNIPIQLAQDDIAARENGDRYRVRSIEPTCGDGLLTVVNVTRE